MNYLPVKAINSNFIMVITTINEYSIIIAVNEAIIRVVIIVIIN